MPRGRGRRRRQDPVVGGRELRIRRAPMEQQQPPVRNERRRPQVEVDEDAPVVRRRRVDEPQLVALQPDVELQENEPQLAALAKNDIWIIGSSLVKKASEHTQTRATGIDLGLEKLGYSIVWIGHSGMLWDMVPSIITALLNWRPPPSIILIHCGGNDLCNIQNGKLLYNIKDTLRQLMSSLPNTTVIWSYILPRRIWRNAMNKKAIERSRARVNRGVRSYLHKVGGKAIKHTDFDDIHPTLFADDGVHLSYIGNDIFINAIQSALELFIKYPNRFLYPDEL
ncbi:Hypothetical predicted protein [Mytilus galloprovincialis]|uniref:SGNH hydrolase-type esterase domain-containing protein n=2 Tax=Mytilus galloprovincialis TaxID=29158 RepID=A0A8B6C9B2_MYTGA|nr:Hypothetical predicted protein [Mytilus galloprovincialis]